MALTLSKPKAVRDGATMGQASPESASCPRDYCRTTLEFHTRQDGSVYGICRRCGYYTDPRAEQQLRASAQEDPMGIQDIPSLPMVEPGQLRCQRCARGVEGDLRFCDECQAERAAAAREAKRAEKIRRGPVASRAKAQYKPRPCLDCHDEFIPTGARARFCPACKAGTR